MAPSPNRTTGKAVFPFRNDLRKILVPYLRDLSHSAWVRTSEAYPRSIAAVVRHIAESEDHWVHVIGLKQSAVLPPRLTTPQELLDAYITIRERTDAVLSSLDEAALGKMVEVPQFADGWVPPSPPTWRWLFHHVYSHEAYHVGQIAMIARMNGIAPPSF